MKEENKKLYRLIAERMGRSFDAVTTSVAERPGQDAAYVIDSGRARAELGWRPAISMEAGIDELVGWVDAHWDQIAAAPLDYRHKP